MVVSRKIKVLHILPRLGQGGAERLLVDLCEHNSAGVEHIIVTLLRDAFPQSPRCRVISLEIDRFGLCGAIDVLRMIPRLRSIIAEERPDILQGWLYYGNLLTLAAPASRRIWSVHNTTLVRGLSNPLLLLADRICAQASSRHVEHIIYCAESARERHEAAGYARTPGIVIPNGVVAQRFLNWRTRRAAARVELDLAQQEVVLAIFARYDPQKNLPFLFECIARARPALGRFRLLMAGRGLDRENTELSAALATRGLLDCAIRLGVTADISPLMAAADIVLLGSSYGEALPLTLIEAVLSERAVVTTDIGDVRGIGIDPDNLVPIDETDAFGRALTRAVESWRMGRGTEQRAEAARRAATAFSIERCVAAYEALYRDEELPPKSRSRLHRGQG